MGSVDRWVKARGVRAAMGLPPTLQRVMTLRATKVDGQRLAPEIQIMLCLRRLAREPAVEDHPVEEGRALMLTQARMVAGDQPIGAVRHLRVPGPAGPMPARLYRPSGRLGHENVPTMLFLHGGGWVYGDLDSHDAVCRFLAERARIQMLAVEYRLAPQAPFPAAVEDAIAAYRWLTEHTDEVGADPERLAVGGDSAGGNLAAVVAIEAARRGWALRHQMLVYPATDFVERRASRDLFGEGFYLTDRFMDQAEEWYCGDHDRSDPRLSPFRTAELPAGMAPALVVTAAFDPLRDEGEAYANKLREAGVEVELIRFDGLIHGFFNMVGAGRATRAAVQQIAAKVAEALR